MEEGRQCILGRPIPSGEALRAAEAMSIALVHIEAPPPPSPTTSTKTGQGAQGCPSLALNMAQGVLQCPSLPQRIILHCFSCCTSLTRCHPLAEAPVVPSLYPSYRKACTCKPLLLLPALLVLQHQVYASPVTEGLRAHAVTKMEREEPPWIKSASPGLLHTVAAMQQHASIIARQWCFTLGFNAFSPDALLACALIVDEAMQSSQY